MLYFSLITLLVYLCYTVWVAKGVPNSISATYYLLKNRWIFQLVMIIQAVCLYVSWIGISHYEYLAFLSCGGVMFVAFAPNFEIKIEGKVHYISAIICGISAVLWLMLMGYGDVFLPLFIGALLLSMFFPKKYMWWMELAVIIGIYIALLG